MPLLGLPSMIFLPMALINMTSLNTQDILPLVSIITINSHSADILWFTCTNR